MVGFLLGLYRRLLGKDEINQIYLFWLLLLLHFLFQIFFENIFLHNLYNSSRASNIADPFEDFSFGPLPQMETRPLKLILKEPEEIPQIPFSILNDPSRDIEIDFIRNEPINDSILYKFEVFQFYQILHHKVKKVL